MKLKFKDRIAASILSLSISPITQAYIDYKANTVKELLTKFRRMSRKKAYVFLDPVKILWNEEEGPKRWTNENTDKMLPPVHYRMTVVADRKDPHDFKTPSYLRYLTLEWFDEYPDGDISLDSLLQRAASVVEYSKYAK